MLLRILTNQALQTPARLFLYMIHDIYDKYAWKGNEGNQT